MKKANFVLLLATLTVSNVWAAPSNNYLLTKLETQFDGKLNIIEKHKQNCLIDAGDNSDAIDKCVQNSKKSLSLTEQWFSKRKQFILNNNPSDEDKKRLHALSSKAGLTDTEAEKEAEAEAQKLADAEKKVEAERLAKEQELEEQKKAFAKLKAEKEAIAKAKAEAEEKLRKEQEKLAKLKEAEAKAKAEAEAKAKAEAERLAKIEAEKLAKEKAEAERLAKIEAEKLAKEKAEKERFAKAKAKAEAEARAKAKAKAEAEARAKAKAERLAKKEAKKLKKFNDGRKKYGLVDGDSVETIVEKLKIDKAEKTKEKWLLVFESERRMKGFGINFLTDSEKEALKAFLIKEERY